MQRCDELAAITDEPGRITRTFHSPAMQRANQLVASWMRAAGLETREDAAFNIIGRLPSLRPDAKTLLLGSHLDTVRDAGKYDGPLGVLGALAVVEKLKEDAMPLPFHLEVVGFSDEEGVRYQTTYLGSRAIAGTLTPQDLARIEEKGIEHAKRNASDFLTYAEMHIEQGPVLEAEGLALGAVSGIAGQTRARVTFVGKAGHAGTTPMPMRKDALCAAAEFILAVEKCGVTATVGIIEAKPGASNVIPGSVALSLDIRDLSDDRREKAANDLIHAANAISATRGTQVEWEPVQATGRVVCDPGLTDLMTAAIAKQQGKAPCLPSGAGHDAVAMSAICPVAMLFVRCKDGLSHHPDESVEEPDVRAAISAFHDFVLQLAARHA